MTRSACEVCGCGLTPEHGDHVGYEMVSGDDACISYLKARVETERAAKRQFATELMNLVEVGRWLANRQPAVHAKDATEADAWAKFYQLLNEAPVSFPADLDAAVKRAQATSSDEGAGL